MRPPEEIDAANAQRVGADLAACVTGGVFELVVDLSTTEFIDSAGIDMLFRLSERLRQRRVCLRVAIQAGSPLARVADIVGLRGAMPVYDDVAKALAAAGDAQATVVPSPPANA
jgi:anti-anti-sigma factor